MMRLTVLGAAGSAPGPDSPCSGYLIEHDGYRLLLDLGPGAAMTLQRFVAPGDVDAAILSHAHSDHYADLLQMWRLRLVTGGGPLPLIVPSDAPTQFVDEPDAFDCTYASEGLRRLGPLDVRLARVVHGECWATRIGDAFCFTADSEPCEALNRLADGARVLLAEACGSDSDGPMGGHLTAGDAARLSVRSGAKLLILTHLRGWNDNAALLAEAAAIAACPVLLATPGLRVAL
jgi:ribonuclease BN (tRNA processing enzyme)